MWSVDMLYNKKRKGFMFYIVDRTVKDPQYVKFFMSDKTMEKRNLTITQLRDFMQCQCNAFGVDDGLQSVMKYYNEE